MEDIHTRMSTAIAVAAAVYAANSTPVTIDLLGYDAAEIILAIGIGGITFTTANKIEFVLSHSDDDTTYTPVTDAHLLGVTGTTAGIIKSLIALQAAATVSRFGYKGGKRYLRVLAQFSGTHGTGTPLAGVAILGDAALAPVANQA